MFYKRVVALFLNHIIVYNVNRLQALVLEKVAKTQFWVFSVISPPSRLSPPPVEDVAAAVSVFAEYAFCQSVDSAHNSDILRSWLLAEAN